jgi:hypothetical protein
LVQKTTPAGGDFLMLSDTSAAGVLKRVAWSDLPGATGGIPESPNDANTYGRHALGWTAIANVVTPSPLSSSNDTNVTLTLGGTPTTALLQNVSITAGWTGRLAYTRFTQGGALSVLGVSGNATADHASIASGGDGQVLRQSGLTLSFGTLTTLSYADASVTYAKIQNVSATARLLGRVSAGAGPVEELTAAQGITVLGLGTAATKNVGGSGASVVPTFDVPGTWTGTQGYPESALTYVSTGATLWPTDTSQVATLSMAAATGNTTMAQPSSVTAGRVYTIRIQQHATTPRAISWNLGSYLWIGGPAAPVISTGGNAVDRFTFIGRTGNVLEEIGRAQDIK